MSFIRFMLLAGGCATLFSGVTAVAETEAETAPEQQQTSLLDDLTIEDMLAAVKRPVQENYRGTVTEITTGALVVIEQGDESKTVRVYGVDCPEPKQPGHEEARAFAASHFLEKGVTVNVVAADSEQQPVALLFNADGDSLSHLLVGTGMAWWDRINAPEDTLLRSLNAEAITESRGLYADLTALAPWDYRDARGIAQISYTQSAEDGTEMADASEPDDVKQEPVSISARGTMTESVPRAPVSIPKDAGKDLDPMALMGRHMPHIVENEAGEPLGLTATDISQIPYAGQLGFQDGDIISKVNGMSVQSIPQIMQMADQFRGVKQFQVEIIRNGQRITIPITAP